MRTIIIVQARMGSKRLPGKVMRQVKGKPLIGYCIDRLNMVQRVAGVVVAIPECDNGSLLEGYVTSRKDCALYCGAEENDLVTRFLGASLLMEADAFIRVCGDSPLIDPQIVQEGVDLLNEAGNISGAFFSNAGIKSIAPGQSVEGCTLATYSIVAMHCKPADREHAGFPWLYRKIKEKSTLVDTAADFERVKGIIEAMKGDHRFYGWRECVNLVSS